MPIKLPKGFQRRKSSGNALDEVRNPPEQSFRVFERPGFGQKSRSTDAVNHLNNPAESKPLPHLRASYEDEDEDLFAHTRGDSRNRYASSRELNAQGSDSRSGGGGTYDSPSMAPYDSAASSARLSTTSTNPSSTDKRSAEHVSVPGDRPFHDIPVPPVQQSRPGFSLRSGGRAFSFGNRSQRTAVTIPPRAYKPANEQPPLPASGRERAATASSSSTATPPKLFDSDLSLDSSELDEFSNMFDNIGRRSVGPSPTGSSLKLLPSTAAAKSSRLPRSSIPASLNIDRRSDIESSPYSSNSQDALLRSPNLTPTVVAQHASSPMLNRYKSPQQQNMRASQQEMTSNPWGVEDTPEIQRPNGFPRRTSLSPLSRGMSTSPEKATNRTDMRYLDAQVVPDRLSPQQRPSSPGSRRSFDSSLAEEVDLAARWREGKAAPAPKTNNKVMTPAQFERYRKQQEMDRRIAGPAGDEASDGEEDRDDDDDEAEAERDRQAVRQRRKQEAHLAVYRQSMMKVTGEQAAGSRAVGTLGAKLRRSSSADPNNRMSYLTVDSKISGKSSNEEDEDEDVPLGILAAHGFPNKNRPPARLVSSSSSSNLLALNPSATPPVAGSAAGTSAWRASVPVFARNLPQDPYFGASLVNSSNREPLAMGGGASAVGVPPTPNMQPYPVHPAGLVGVIANEERSRAMRRGSPNASGHFEGPPQHSGMPRPMTQGAMSTMGHPDMTPGSPPALTPGELQMSQQMAQMMQMQAQWMQQMQQMMGGPPGPPGPPMLPPLGAQPSMLAPPQPVQRPYSLPMPLSAGAPGQRSMSTLSPSMANWNRSSGFLPAMNGNGGPSYAASLAPSERSNVGLAPRYRPVSTATATNLYNPASQRSSTFTSGTIRPVLPEKRASGMAVAVTDDEDDDPGWKEMKAKRDKRTSVWKLKKAHTGLQDLYQSGM